MAVLAMSRLELFGLRGDLVGIMDHLQRAEAVEIVATEVDAHWPGTSLSAIERELAEIERLLGLFDRMAPRRPNLIEQFAGTKTVLTRHEFTDYAADVPGIEKTIEQARSIEAGVAAANGSLHEQESLLAQLLPWSDLRLSQAELDGTRHVRVLLGSVERMPFDRFAADLRGLETRALPIHLATEGEGFRAVVLWPRESDQAPLLEKLGFNPASLPPFTGHVGDAIDAINTRLAELKEQMASLTNEAGALAKARPRVEARYDFLRGELAKAQAMLGLSATRHAFRLDGWIPSRRIQELNRQLDGAGFSYAMTTRPPGPDEEPPVILNNPGVANPFEALIEGFSYPKPGEIDPTKVTAPFFFIFFGFCLSDAGYGLLLILFCLSLLKWLKMGPVGRKLSRMFILGGFGAILMGLLTGGLFGDLLRLPALIDPIKNAMILLGLALALGLIQLFLGTVLSALPSIHEGQWRDAFFNQGVWLLFLTSMIFLLAKAFVTKGPVAGFLGRYGGAINIFALTTSILVIYSATRGKKGVLGKLLGIPAGLFNIYGSIGFFSDVLSYSRLMALGLSGGVMAMIINMFARMAAGGGQWYGVVIGIVIGVFGHTLNVALGILGAYVHSSRLQFLEFYGKFYEGGGRQFRPLRLQRKFTFLVEEREA